MTAHDRTFQDVCRFGSDRWCAAALGMSIEQFRKQRQHLEAHSGFPQPDPILGSTLKAAVDDWICRRNPVSSVKSADLKPGGESINFDAL